MQLGIIGAGNVGRALAAGWLRSGHSITFGVRDPRDARMGADGLELEIGHTMSGGERVAALAQGASVFKTLNQTGFENMERAGSFVPPAVMYVVGDDDAHRPQALYLVSDLGFQAVDAGPLRIARLLQPMAMLWIHMALVRGEPRSQAFTLTQRGG
jgi:predicted dinucleotide-binding enzyme